MPQYGAYDTASFPSPFKEAFRDIRVGDSIVIRIPTDSIIAKGQSAPFIKKGQFVYQTYSVVNIYTDKAKVDSAQKSHIPVAQAKAYQKQIGLIEKELATNKATIDKDSKAIEAYLSAHNLKATKTKWGTYVQINTEGSGSLITNKDVATVNYTGRTFDSSKVFDSNIDPKFKHVQPYDVAVGQLSGIIIAWPDALQQMKKGTKATIYVPSSLAYGKQGRAPEIGPDQILVFDMDVLDVMSEEARQAKQEEEDKKNKAAQQHMLDSLKAANPQPKAGK
jgi:FKBP-type peptidyl-prolyl cis-trans isomerase